MCVVPKVWHQEEVLGQAAILKHSIVLLEIPSPDHTEEGPQSWGSPPQHLIQPAAVWHHRTTSSSIGPSKKRVPCSTMVPFSWSVHLVLDLLIMSVTLEVIKCNFSLLPSFQCPHLVCSGGPMAQFSGVGRDAAFEDFFFLLKPFCQCCLMVIGLQSAPVMVLIWVVDRPLSWRTAPRVLRLSAGAVFDSTRGLFCSTRVLWSYWKCLFGCVWPQLRWHAARSLAYLNNPTAFKHRKLLCLCHQEVWQTEIDTEFKYLARFCLLLLVSLPSVVFAHSTWNVL